MKNARTIRQLIAATAAVFLGFLPKVVGCIFLAGTCAWPAGAALVVATNDFMEVTTATTITGPTNIYIKNFVSGVENNSRIQADLSLTSETFLRFIGDTSSKPTMTYLDFGPALGDGGVTVSTDANSGLYTSYRRSTGEGGLEQISYIQARIGQTGGSATFVVSGSVKPGGYDGFYTVAFGVWFYDLLLTANATTTAEYFDIATLNTNGRMNIRRFENANAKPARILFNGGQLDLWYVCGGNEYTPFYATTGVPLYLTSQNSKPIVINKTAKSVNSMTYGDGTIYVQGPEFRLGSDNQSLKSTKTGVVTYSDLSYHFTTGASTFDWTGLTGDVVLYGKTGLTLEGNDLLPWGTNKGKLRIENSNDVAKDNSPFNRSCLILNGGTTTHLNGIVRGGTYSQYACVTNTTPNTPATIILGDGDVDGVLAIDWWDGVNISKVGSGQLIVSNVTISADSGSDGVLAINSGSVLFVGTNTVNGADLCASLKLTIGDGVNAVCEVLVNVASGTVTNSTLFADYANGIKLRLRKTGAGTLVLNNVNNSFTGGIVVDGGSVELARVDAVWTANGSDASTGTAANWKDSMLPNFSNYLCPYRPVFGEGGSEALFPSGISYLNGLKFSRESDFTVRGTADTKLVFNGTVEVVAGESKLDQRRYDIAAPIEVANAAQTWNVPTNRTLRTSGGITNAEGVPAWC